MVNVITELSKYVMALLLALYTLYGFWLVRKSDEEKSAALWQQNLFLIWLHLLGSLILYLNTIYVKYSIANAAGCSKKP